MLEAFCVRRRPTAVSCLTLVLLFSPAAALARQEAAGPAAARRPAPQAPQPQTPADGKAAVKAWSVQMSKAAPHTFTVKAKDARLAEVAGEISRLLKVPVTLTPLMEKQRVTLDFGGLNLEATLRMLAPQPYVDYVLGGDDPDQPKPLAVYLQGANERPPSQTASVRGSSEAILIEGDTEEGTDGQAQKKEEDPLKVTYANNQLSVRAHKQPLSVVLFKIANEIGVPFELRYESPEVIDVEFSNYTLEQALRSLSPEVRFYYRLDLQTFQAQPLRMALVAPASLKS
jgi:hypothetical protein